jgi:hypothetical protein
MNCAIALHRAVVVMIVVGFLGFVPILCLLAAHFTANEEVRGILDKSFLYGALAWFPTFFLSSAIALALRLRKWRISSKQIRR